LGGEKNVKVRNNLNISIPLAHKIYGFFPVMGRKQNKLSMNPPL